ncbi:helix-turn-helix domain-containing protein [bacterium]|nr:helix-turn-helix domain-containing protein [bacterium]
MNIRPIHTEEDYDNVLIRINMLIDAEPNTEEFDELEVLSVLAESYEIENHEIPSPDPIEALKNIMEWRGLTRKDLEPIIGTRARVSEILNGKRRLSLNMIINLKTFLNIPADILLPSHCDNIKIAI